MHTQNYGNEITDSYINSFIFTCPTENKKYELRIKPENKNNSSISCPSLSSTYLCSFKKNSLKFLKNSIKREQIVNDTSRVSYDFASGEAV